MGCADVTERVLRIADTSGNGRDAKPSQECHGNARKKRARPGEDGPSRSPGEVIHRFASGTCMVPIVRDELRTLSLPFYDAASRPPDAASTEDVPPCKRLDAAFPLRPSPRSS